MGGVARAIGGAITAPFKAAASVVGGVIRGAGQVLKGAGQILTGDFKGGLHSMFIKSGGEVLSGALGGAKAILGNPITAGVAGFMLGGPLGAMAGVGFGGAAAGFLGNMQNSIQQGTGIGPYADYNRQNNCDNFGPNNGQFGDGCGNYYPPQFPPQMYPQPMPWMPQQPWGQQPPWAQPMPWVTDPWGGQPCPPPPPHCCHCCHQRNYFC